MNKKTHFALTLAVLAVGILPLVVSMFELSKAREIFRDSQDQLDASARQLSACQKDNDKIMVKLYEDEDFIAQLTEQDPVKNK
jgi:hypothetical protein